MTPELTLTIPDEHWISANDRRHWRANATRRAALRALAADVARTADLPRFMQVHVGVFVGYPTRRRADPTNAADTLKPCLDGLTDAGVWEDDDSEHVVAVTFMRDLKCSPKGHHTLRLVLTDQCLPFGMEDA